MKKIITTMLCLLVLTATSYAQNEQVRKYLNMIAKGKSEEVKKKLPAFVKQYPKEPGTLLIQGILTENAEKALEIYKKIVKTYPKSDWADDAYWRIVQYYAVSGNLDKAKEELASFRKNYPNSDYLLAATEVVRSAISISKKSKKDEHKDKKSDTKDKKAEVKIASEDSEDIEETNSDKNKTEEKKEIKNDDSNSDDDKDAKYGLQVGLYNSYSAASDEMKKYRQKRMETKVITKNIDGQKKYAVVIGNYSSREAAEAAKEIVKQSCNCKPVILKK